MRFTTVLKLSKKQYVKEAHSPEREMMLPNGHTSLLLFEKNFEKGGIYSMNQKIVYQLKLMEMILDAVKYFNYQFFI